MRLSGHLLGIVLSSAFVMGLAAPCQADEWSRVQEAQRRAQASVSAAQSLCASQSSARAQIQGLAEDIQMSYNTFSQRLQDNIINDVQADLQTLSPMQAPLEAKANQLQQAIGAMQSNINLLTQAVQGGLPSGSYPDVRQLLDQARALHDAIEDVMEKNQPLMSFTPKPSYALWLALANNKQNPSWYQGRDQAHVTLQDDLDTVMRQAYQIYGNRTLGAAISGPMTAQIHQDFRALGQAVTPLMTKVSDARQATDRMLVAMREYPNVVRTHRAQLAQDTENKVKTIEGLLLQAQTACRTELKDKNAAELNLTPPGTPIASSTQSPFAAAVLGKDKVASKQK